MVNKERGNLPQHESLFLSSPVCFHYEVNRASAVLLPRPTTQILNFLSFIQTSQCNCYSWIKTEKEKKSLSAYKPGLHKFPFKIWIIESKLVLDAVSIGLRCKLKVFDSFPVNCFKYFRVLLGNKNIYMCWSGTELLAGGDVAFTFQQYFKKLCHIMFFFEANKY